MSTAVRHKKQQQQRRGVVTPDTAQPVARMKRMLYRNGLARLQKGKRSEIQHIVEGAAEDHLHRILETAMLSMLASRRSRLRASDVAHAAETVYGIQIAPRATFARAQRLKKMRQAKKGTTKTVA
jgi:hypothetical protein